MEPTTIMRILREANGYTQEYVGSKLGIEQNTYSKLETGQIKLSVDRIQKLAKLYKIDPEVFLFKEISVVHFNTGKGSHSNSGTIENYCSEILSRDLVDKVLMEKERIILMLQSEILDLKKQRDQLLNLLNKSRK